MPRYIAFLRAINVGGHNVKMERLREIFESLKFNQVETFIASGNVIFESDRIDTKALETEIESQLKTELGYEVATFLRSDSEVAQIAEHTPFPPALRSAAEALNIGFLKVSLNAEGESLVMAFKSDIDDFHVHEREVYWLCRKKQSESTFSNVVFERKLKQKGTWRGVNTIQRITAKYPPTTG